MNLTMAGADVITGISNVTNIVKTVTESINGGHVENTYVISITCL